MTGSSFRLRVYPSRASILLRSSPLRGSPPFSGANAVKESRLLMDSMLFLSEINLYRASEEVEVASKLVLQETSVRLADILRKITEECK